MEGILIQVETKCSAYGDIRNNNLDLSVSSEDLLNQKYFIGIYETDSDLHNKGKIGTIEMTYMDVCMAEETGYDVFMLFDLIDAEKQGVCNYLFDDNEPNDEYVGMDLDVIYIDKIFIKKEYRNMGIGSSIVKELPMIVRNILKLRPGCLVLLANPFEIEDKELIPERDKEKIEKLIRFYQKNGFERIENTQYLARNMDYK